MKKILVAFLTILIMIPSFVSACAIASFEREGTTVEPIGLSQALIVWNDGVEHLILDPKLKGAAKDFGLAFAFPARPEVNESSRVIFRELAAYTKPKVVYRARADTGSFFGAGRSAPPASAAPPIIVVEEKEVGDFSVAVLQATDANALIAWLQENNYRFTDGDRANFDYYVQKKGYTFVALKMRPQGDTVGERPLYAGDAFNFTPIEFVFQTPTALFPSRLARDNDPLQQFRVYTLSKQPLIVYGAATPFVKKITAADTSA